MTGWVVATATTAMLGAAVIGPGPLRFVEAQSAQPPIEETLESAQDADSLTRAFPDIEQAVRIAGSGGRIGVTIRDLSDEEIKGGKTSAGVKIDEVETDSPAAKAGFRSGDVVVEFDGERVRSTRQFARLVQETPSGRQVQAAVVREGQRVSLSVQPRDGGFYGSFKGFDNLVTAARTIPAPAFKSFEMLPRVGVLAGAGRLGIAVDELSSQLAEYFGTKDGVLVTSVNDNSAASKAGLKAGDVITSLNGGSVTTAADLRRRAQRLEDGDEFTLNVVRDKKTVTVKGKIEAVELKRLRGRTIL